MSKHTEKLQKLGEFTLNQWLGLGIALGGSEQVEKLLRCKKVTIAFDAAEKLATVTATDPQRRWREKDGVIYFSLTSDGTTGPEWIKRLGQKGFRLSDYAKYILKSPDFKPTSGVTSEIAVLKGTLFKDNDRITKKIRAEGKRRILSDPNAEIACLIRENFSDEEIEAMGLVWIVTMHKSIEDSGGGPSLLSVLRGGDGLWLGAYCGSPDHRWDRDDGFAFVASQVSPEG